VSVAICSVCHALIAGKPGSHKVLLCC